MRKLKLRPLTPAERQEAWNSLAYYSSRIEGHAQEAEHHLQEIKSYRLHLERVVYDLKLKKKRGSK